mgnify:CR=1 FL=1
MDYFSAKEMLIIGIVLGASLTIVFQIMIADLKGKL